MSRPRTRCTVAALVLGALLASAIPVRAASFAPGGLPLPDFWARAWSWLTDLWSGDRPQGVATPEAAAKGLSTASTKPPKPKPPAGTMTGRPGGDAGVGADPDG
jgi:hypothetical protein